MARRARAWIDITMEFGHPGGTFEGDAPLRVDWTARLGDPSTLGVNLSRITSSPHNGTHSDAAFHVLPDGAKSEALPVDAYLGPCLIVDATRVRGPLLGPEMATPVKRSKVERVLFKTRRGPPPDRFRSDFKGLSIDLAEALVAARVRLVGTDAPSVDRADHNGLRCHRILFGGGAVPLENLDLSRVRAGRYELLALPLKVPGLCAAPVRALVRPKP